MEQLPLYIYAGMCVSFLTALVLQIRTGTTGEKAAVLAGRFFCTAGVAAIILLEKRLPLFGIFESTLYIAFWLSWLDCLAKRSLPARLNKKLSTETSLFILILLMFQLNQPMAFNHDYFMYTNVWTNLFFNLRLAAAAFFIHAALLFLNGGWQAGGEEQTVLMKKGRNFLLAGATIYLAGEWAGSLWCLNWLGDSWQWSKGFFKASAVFLLAMMVLHLPPFFTNRKRAKAVFGSLPALFMLWMILYH